MSVLSKLAAAAAERPPPLLACGTSEDFGSGVEGDVVVLAIQLSVCTSELNRGVLGLEPPIAVPKDGCTRGGMAESCEGVRCMDVPCDVAKLETVPPSCSEDMGNGCWLCESEVKRGLFVRL